MRNGYSSIASYANPIEAEMACEHLRSSGIDAQLTNASAASSMYGAGNPIMNQALYVPVDRVSDARSLLEEIDLDEGTRSSVADPAIEPAYDGFQRSDWNRREKAAEIAYRASIVGWLVPGVSWYALWKLGDVIISSESLCAAARSKALIAGLFSLLPAMGWLIIALLAVMN